MREIGIVFEERKLLPNYLNIARGFKMEREQKIFIARLNPALIHINFSVF